tara:strand:- start:202 stop:408 length:207 start_codon:yes stop_codon:yes gene_type:complete
MNKKIINLKTNLNNDPKNILKKLNIPNVLSYEFCFYKANRGWQIAGVYKNKNYLIDCYEDQDKVLIYQ